MSVAVARFIKQKPAPMSMDHDGYELRAETQPISHYQMVPIGGTRELRMHVSGRVKLLCDPKVCQFTLGSLAPTHMAVLNHEAITEYRLTLHPQGIGRTALVAVADPLKYPPLDILVISVKKEATVTYNLHLLTDLRHPNGNKRTFDELNNMMQTVEKVYLKQANVRLHKVQGNVLFIKDDFGDPIDMLKPPPISVRTNVREVVLEKLRELGMTKERVNLISTWNLKNHTQDLHGFTPGFETAGWAAMCFLQKENDALGEASNFAHELGHALGLAHDGHTVDFLMNGLGADSFKMSAADIDQLNPSGTK